MYIQYIKKIVKLDANLATKAKEHKKYFGDSNGDFGDYEK